jgi:hypothetical protein
MHEERLLVRSLLPFVPKEKMTTVCHGFPRQYCVAPGPSGSTNELLWYFRGYLQRGHGWHAQAE